MFVERLHLIDTQDGKLQLKDAGRFDVYFDERDMETLVDPDRGVIGDRFMGCTEQGTVSGWMPEDKIHVQLEHPRTLEDEQKVAQLQLDGGGDLYFTIWNSIALQQYQPNEFMATEPFLTGDPSNKLARVGIQSFCLHQLSDLAAMIEKRQIP